MPDFTKALAAGLDARRQVFHGSNAKLMLLDYARPNRRGYDVLLMVDRGWHFADSDKGELPTLLIAELELVTAELLLKAAGTAFAINGEVYKVNENDFKKPVYATKRVWAFTVKPTGQQFP